jgi:hypothetical protein
MNCSFAISLSIFLHSLCNTNHNSNVNVLSRFYKQFLTSLYRLTLFGIFFKQDSETKLFAIWTKATLLRIYFRNLSVQKSFLQYKSQYLEKVFDVLIIEDTDSPSTTSGLWYFFPWLKFENLTTSRGEISLFIGSRRRIYIYDIKFSISSLVSTLDPYQPSSFAVGLDMGVSG